MSYTKPKHDYEARERCREAGWSDVVRDPENGRFLCADSHGDVTISALPGQNAWSVVPSKDDVGRGAFHCDSHLPPTPDQVVELFE